MLLMQQNNKLQPKCIVAHDQVRTTLWMDMQGSCAWTVD
jgi:hypothetical protein